MPTPAIIITMTTRKRPQNKSHPIITANKIKKPVTFRSFRELCVIGFRFRIKIIIRSCLLASGAGAKRQSEERIGKKNFFEYDARGKLGSTRFLHSDFGGRFNCVQAEAWRTLQNWDSRNGNSSDMKLLGIVCVCVCDPATTTKTNADTRANQSHRKVWNGRR